MEQPEHYYQNIIGQNIAKKRSALGWSQEQFAAKLQVKGWDISRGTVAKIESRIRLVTDIELLFLAKVLRCDLTHLLEASSSEVLGLINKRSRNGTS